MKSINILLGLSVLTTILFTSCLNDPFKGNEPARKGNSLTFTLTLPDHTVVESRAYEDKTINNIYAVVFDGNTDEALLVDYSEAFLIGSEYHITLKPETTSGYVYVLANVATGLNLTESTISVTTLSDVRKSLIIKLQQKDGYIVQDPQYSPMSSELIDYSSQFPANKTIDVILKRATAKVTVINKVASHIKYTLKGANLGNAPTVGNVIENIGAATTPNLAHYAGLVAGETYSVENMMRSVTTNGTTGSPTTEPLYMFESPKENESFVIIKGEYNGIEGYHKLNLWDRKTDTYFDITRNYHYIVNISKVTTPGYRTAQEAIDSKASNRDIEFDIVITDPYSHDIVTNGEQYLSVSNSHARFFYTGGMGYATATRLSYTVPSQGTWKVGTVTVKGEGITLSESMDGTTMELPLVNTNGREIKVNIRPAFKFGTLEFRIGDLIKVVTITKADNIPAIAGEIEFDGSVIGDRTSSGVMKTAIRFTDKSGKYNDDDRFEDIYAGSTNKIYALLSSNIGYRENVAERRGEFYVAGLDDTGRTFVSFEQHKLDVYTHAVQIKPYTYVGTFHRADETAERIIRIKPAKSDSTAVWTATVVAGSDFIELDTNDSPDPGINKFNPYGYDESDPDNQAKWDNSQWANAASVEANCQFKPSEKGKLFVAGKGNLIYFRVGLKSKLPGGPTAEPRYGLIALTHPSGSHLIYVRQGEAADYLMRPDDPISSGSIIRNTRPNAKKIVPFNITLPENQRSQKWHDVPVNGGVSTDYPSKGGYVFQGNSRRAFFPVGTATSVNWYNNSLVGTGGVEVCPINYRRPNDGAALNNGFSDGSEMRQSFWLNPQNGVAYTNTANMLRGYLADGYYDRRVMRVPNTQGHSDEGVNIYSQEIVAVDGKNVTFTIPTMVGEGAEIGYAGMLIYNPNNFGSIFIPANGRRAGQTGDGTINGTGATSNIWSSSYFSDKQMWYLATGYYTSGFVFDNYKSAAGYEGFSIRCVKNLND